MFKTLKIQIGGKVKRLILKITRWQLKRVQYRHVDLLEFRQDVKTALFLENADPDEIEKEIEPIECALAQTEAEIKYLRGKVSWLEK